MRSPPRSAPAATTTTWWRTAAGTALLAGCALGAESGTPLVASTGWQPAGWGGGSFYWAAAWHPSDENILYMGSDSGGLFRSEDKGRHWRLANLGLCHYTGYSLAVSPAAPDMVYALTDGGLCRSRDQARHWEFIPASAAAQLDIRSARDGSVRAVAIDPQHAAIVYAGSRSGKLFKSVDGGDSWRELPYRDALPTTPEPPACHGRGALVLIYESAIAGPDTRGRVGVNLSQGADHTGRDWSTYRTLSARFRLPEGAPLLQAQLVVQSGADWQWQEGPWSDGTPGSWSTVALDLTTLKNVADVRMVHVVLRSPQAAWHGTVRLDAVALHATASTALADPGTLLLADWEQPGDTGGWTANRSAKDTLHLTAARQSAAKVAGDVVSSVVVVRDAPTTVYVSNTCFGAFRSDDGGTTWTALATPPHVLSLTGTDAASGVVWAACGADGIRRSHDRGQTWEAVNGWQEACRDVAHLQAMQIREISVHPTAPQRVYVIGNAQWNGALLRSDDDGKSWSRVSEVQCGTSANNPNHAYLGAAAHGREDLSRPTSLALNPRNPDELFIAANWRNVFSTDGGRTLEERSTGADNTCHTDIRFCGGNTYVTAMDEGLFVSADNGGEWRQLLPRRYEPALSGHFWRVLPLQSGETTRLIATNSPWASYGDPRITNRVQLSADDGATFSMTTAGLPDTVAQKNCMWGRSIPRALAADPRDPQVLYLGMDGDPDPTTQHPGGGIFRSADGGQTWARCAGQPGSRRMFYGLAVDPTDSQRLFWGGTGSGGGVWRSADMGVNWELVFKGETWIWNLEVAPSGAVLACGKNLWRSRDHGATWTQLTHFTGAPVIVGLALDPANEQRFWCARTTWLDGGEGGIFRTTDGGMTWQDITGDSPYRKPQLLRYNPATRELWAGGVGLFKLQQ